METVYLVTLENNIQATILQDVLRNEGIESFVKNEFISSVLNIPSFKIELNVFEEDYEKALDILKKGFPYLVEK